MSKKEESEDMKTAEERIRNYHGLQLDTDIIWMPKREVLKILKEAKEEYQKIITNRLSVNLKASRRLCSITEFDANEVVEISKDGFEKSIGKFEDNKER